MSGNGIMAAFGRRRPVASRLRQATYVGLSRRSVARGLLSGRPAERGAAGAGRRLLETSTTGSNLHGAFRSGGARQLVLAGRSHSRCRRTRRRHQEIAREHAPWMEPELVRHPGWLGTESPSGQSHERDAPRWGTAVCADRASQEGRSSVVLLRRTSMSVADLGWFWLRWFFATMPCAIHRPWRWSACSPFVRGGGDVCIRAGDGTVRAARHPGVGKRGCSYQLQLGRTRSRPAAGAAAQRHLLRRRSLPLWAEPVRGSLSPGSAPCSRRYRCGLGNPRAVRRPASRPSSYARRPTHCATRSEGQAGLALAYARAYDSK